MKNATEFSVRKPLGGLLPRSAVQFATVSGGRPFPAAAARGDTRPPRSARWRALGAVLGLFLLPAVAFAQLGPYEIQLAADHFPAQLLRREKNGDVWLRRINPDGTPGPQVGYAAADLTGVAMPRPAFFSNIEAMVAALAAPSADAAARAHAALDKFILQSRPFRDLPGVVSDEAVFLKGRVLDRQGKYPEAIRLYEELRAKTNPESSFAETARIREGIDHAKLTNSLDAVECLAGLILPEEDEPLLSELLFALGDSYAQLENWDNALLSYLTLAVFYPYAGNNEARALTRAMTCYAALGEWEPLYRTIQDTIAIDPAGPAADYARRFAKKYAKELGQAGQFVEGGERVVADVAATAVEGTVAATEAPEHTQIQTAPAVSETVAETVEYPDDLL